MSFQLPEKYMKRLSINLGLPIVEANGADEINEGTYIQVNWRDATVTDLSTGRKYIGKPVPKFLAEIIEMGGLINILKLRYGSSQVVSQ